MQEYTADHKMTSSQNIHNIDVSKMSEKEICSLPRIKSVPWYKDVFFWWLSLVITSIIITSISTMLMLYIAKCIML